MVASITSIGTVYAVQASTSYTTWCRTSNPYDQSHKIELHKTQKANIIRPP